MPLAFLGFLITRKVQHPFEFIDTSFKWNRSIFTLKNKESANLVWHSATSAHIAATHVKCVQARPFKRKCDR